MIGNLFVDYEHVGEGFWFGFALFGAIWTLMLTFCLTLDTMRDRDPQWIYDPLKNGKARWATIPMSGKFFFPFTLALATPACLIVIIKAKSCCNTIGGILLGCFCAWLLMEIGIYCMRCIDKNFRALPWTSLGCFKICPPISKGMEIFERAVSFLAKRVFTLPEFYFDTQNCSGTGHNSIRLKANHVYGIWSVVWVLFVYACFSIYLDFIFDADILEARKFPPAVFIYALLLPLIWLVTLIWTMFFRYRITLLVLVVYTVLSATYGGITGQSTHTFDVRLEPKIVELNPEDVFVESTDNPEQTLIIVAASGGGILASGWTTIVLTNLESKYQSFSKELRLLSTVSGGSVGAAFYINQFKEDPDLYAKQNFTRSDKIVDNSMETSLAVTAYGLAFPDFQRIFCPFFSNSRKDRGHLAEKFWRSSLIKHKQQIEENPVLNAVKSVHGRKYIESIKAGHMPAIIFNTTVMETGELIAITPFSFITEPQIDSSQYLSYRDRNLQNLYRDTFKSVKNAVNKHKRLGLRRKKIKNLSIQQQENFEGWLKTMQVPINDAKNERQRTIAREALNNYERQEQERIKTLSEFLGAKDTYAIDIWTAARLSATFSYVSPAARAFVSKEVGSSQEHEHLWGKKDKFHFIDGGYHDNYGVMSALNWLKTAINRYEEKK